MGEGGDVVRIFDFRLISNRVALNRKKKKKKQNFLFLFFLSPPPFICIYSFLDDSFSHLCLFRRSSLVPHLILLIYIYIIFFFFFFFQPFGLLFICVSLDGERTRQTAAPVQAATPHSNADAHFPPSLLYLSHRCDALLRLRFLLSRRGVLVPRGGGQWTEPPKTSGINKSRRESNRSLIARTSTSLSGLLRWKTFPHSSTFPYLKKQNLSSDRI